MTVAFDDDIGFIILLAEGTLRVSTLFVRWLEFVLVAFRAEYQHHCVIANLFSIFRLQLETFVVPVLISFKAAVNEVYHVESQQSRRGL